MNQSQLPGQEIGVQKWGSWEIKLKSTGKLYIHSKLFTVYQSQLIKEGYYSSQKCQLLGYTLIDAWAS